MKNKELIIKEFEKKSFKSFCEFKKETDRENILKYFEKFNNMGEFYVVGYKIVKTILEKIGIEKFREIILEAKNGNPQIFIDEYEKIIASA